MKYKYKILTNNILYLHNKEKYFLKKIKNNAKRQFHLKLKLLKISN